MDSRDERPRQPPCERQGFHRAAFRGLSTSVLPLAILLAAWTLPGQGAGQSPDLAQLAQRIAELEAKVEALDAGRSRIRAPFEIVDSTGKTVLAVAATPSGPLMTIGGAGSGSVALGVGASGAGYVLVRRSNGTHGVAMGQREGHPMGLVVLDAAGQKTVARVSADAGGYGEIAVGDMASGGSSLGVGASGAGYFLLRRADGADGAAIGQREGRPMSVHVFDPSGGEPVATLGAHEAGGGTLMVADSTAKPMFRVSEAATARDARVTVGAGEGRYGVTVSGSSGTLLAALGEAKNGAGAVSTFNPSGAMRAVMNGLNGEIHIIDAGGTSRATMASNGSDAAFTVRNAGGTTIARLGEGQAGGWIQLANSGGNAMVEGGIHPSGVGLVRTFPVGSPSAGLVGMPGTFLLGRAGAK